MTDAPRRPPPEALPLDLMAFPFSGAQVIEASAGTGKTWTLSALYLRLLLEPWHDGRRLLPPDILVMTFTDAATQELRDRIRRRIVAAEECFRLGEAWHGNDTFLPRLRERFAMAQWPDAAQRLALAGQWMDEAAIHTIHGWSSRMLREHAFDSGSLFRQERVEDSDELQREVVRDYWRRHLYALGEVPPQALERYPSSPEALWHKVRPLLQRMDRAPSDDGAAAPWPGDVPAPAEALRTWASAHALFERQQARVRALWQRHRLALEEQLRNAMETQLSAVRFPRDHRETYLATMQRWCQGEDLPTEMLAKFGTRNLLAAKLKKAAEVVDTHGVFQALQDLVDADPGAPPSSELLPHAALWVHAECAARKRRSARFDFHDLLQRLHDALQAPDRRLARAIRSQYPVALVDEFQDTDRWQYGALRSIYLDEPAAAAALIMIGDPKQAIYGFRGADLPTYLHARRNADGLHTLDENHRSTPALVEAVNHVFCSAESPFDEIGFHPVRAARQDLPPLQHGGRDLPALTVWHLAGDKAAAVLPLRRQLAERFATQIVRLLAQGSALPADIAVLVRNRREAALVRDALARRQVRSVYMSERDSVYATAEAQDLWAVLDAITRPRSVNALKAALSTRLLGFEPAELDALFADERRFEAEAERFARWQQTWQRQGILPLLHAVLHELGLPARLLDGQAGHRGERRLTNLLHIADLLQAASLSLQGERALVRFLAEQLRQPEDGTDAVQMRLETDAALVKVVTLHKSKGLQYPVVFIPFACDYREATRVDGLPEDGPPPEVERLAEDVRLLYVGFTRAERALYVGAATRSKDIPKKGGRPKSALSHLLGRRSETDLVECLARWTACTGIVAEPLPEAVNDPWVPAAAERRRRPARKPQRLQGNAWRSTSFSSMTRGLERSDAPAPADEREERYADALVDQSPTSDEVDGRMTPATAGTPWQAFRAGAAYGDLLHALLEWQLQAGWPLLDPTRPQQDWQAVLAARSTALDLDAGQQQLLCDWLAAVARCPLDVPGSPLPCLAELPAAGTWAEMGFTLNLKAAATARIDQLVQRYVLPGQPRPALTDSLLQGQLVGFLDLIIEHDGRFHVLDYKSNRLKAGYDRPQLEAAVLDHRYDLQYVLYLVALHRLLKVRLPGYDYDRHVGGAIYLFARGIGTAGNGLYHDKPPRELIEGLSALFREGDAP